MATDTISSGEIDLLRLAAAPHGGSAETVLEDDASRRFAILLKDWELISCGFGPPRTGGAADLATELAFTLVTHVVPAAAPAIQRLKRLRIVPPGTTSFGSIWGGSATAGGLVIWSDAGRLDEAQDFDLDARLTPPPLNWRRVAGRVRLIGVEPPRINLEADLP
jgi:hypothetical protein